VADSRHPNSYGFLLATAVSVHGGRPGWRIRGRYLKWKLGGVPKERDMGPYKCKKHRSVPGSWFSFRMKKVSLFVEESRGDRDNWEN
jgi:hypothetical protein